MIDAYYLELLRSAHLHAVQAGVPLTDGREMGLGGRISSRDEIRVPQESSQLDAKANEFLGQLGLTREQVVNLLTNQLGVTQEELVYAWDIPTYPVMREGRRQEPFEPEFFMGNPLDPESSPYTGGAYRPNNWFTYRQGRDVSQDMTTQSAPMSGEGYNPNNPLKRFGRESVRTHPDAEGPIYEHTQPFIHNKPLGWMLEATVGAAFGPTGRHIARAGGGRLFRLMAQNLNVLPDSLLAKFTRMSEIFDPSLKPPGTPKWRLEGTPPELRYKVEGPPGTPTRWTDSQLGDFYEALGHRGRDEQGFRIPMAEPDRAAVDDFITEMIHNAGYGDYVDDPLFREFVEGVVSPQSDQRLRGFPSAKNRADLDRLAPEGWPSQSDIEAHPEIARWLEIERELAAKYPDNPDFVQQAHDTMDKLHGVRTQDLWEQYPDAETATTEQWRERLGAPPGSTAGDVTPGLGDRVDEAFEDVLDLEEITGAHLSTIPEDMLPEGYSQGSGGPGMWLPDENHMEPLFPEDLAGDEEILDFLGVTHIGGVARRDMAYEGINLEEVAALHNVPVEDLGPQHIQEMLDADALSEAAAVDLQDALSTYRAWMFEGSEQEGRRLRQGLWDDVNETVAGVPPVTDILNARGGVEYRARHFPEGVDRDKSILNNFDPMKELDPWSGSASRRRFRVGDVDFSLVNDQPGEVHVFWDMASMPADTPMERAGSQTRDALREMNRMVDRLVASGVKVTAMVDSSRPSLVNMYRRAGFTISHEFTGEVIPPSGRYAGMGMLDAVKDPNEMFRQAALRGDHRSGYGLPFRGEEEWSGNIWALGKINGYSDDDIAHYYLVREMEGYKPGSTRSPFFEQRPGRDPYARHHNIKEMEQVPQDVVERAYQRMREDRAATGYGYPGWADDEVVPIPGMEEEWTSFQSTVGVAADEVEEAAMSFGGHGTFRPEHDIGDGNIRISNIMRHTSTDGASRDIIVVELEDGTMQPFYRRSGSGDAVGDDALLTTGGGGGAHMWVPFDGIGQYGMGRHWFRKTRFTQGRTADDPLYRYGTEELKDVGDALDQYFLMSRGADPYWDVDGVDEMMPYAYNYQEVGPNDIRAGDEGFLTPERTNELLGVHNTDDYSAMLGTSTHVSPMIQNPSPEGLSRWNSWGQGIVGTAYGAGALGAVGATDFLAPLLAQREVTFEEALAGTAPQQQPVHSMLAWQAKNNEGWWSWIRDYPEHLEWMAKATAATMDALERTNRSTNNEVLDGLSDGFRQQAFGLATQLKESAVPLVGREDPELLQGVSRDLSQNGYNGHQIFSNEIRREIENGDAMIVGYRSDADRQRALEAANAYGVVVDGNYWRRPSDNSLKPREGEDWTREHLQKMATAGYFGGAS
jgi:hypothetical protein